MKPGNKWGRVAIVLLAGGIAIGAGAAANAHGDRGWHQRGGAAMDPAKMDERIESRVKRMLKRVDASEEQRTKVADIAKKAVADLRGMRAKQSDLRKRGIALLSAPTIDRAAIESLRVEQIRLADEASKRMSVALADTAEVLTPEQRAKIAERMQKRGERMKRHGEHRQRG
ncbi:MAG: Spy/CpxP family protein refolding chaperone [Burkholderiales bacterium]